MKSESRRTVPISAITLLAIVALLSFEGLVIGGAFEVRAATIARMAPWAYEPFLRLVGEHPDSFRHRQYAGDEKQSIENDTAGDAGGFDIEPLLMDTGPETVPEPDSVAEETPAQPPENILPEQPREDEVPVG